MSRGMKGSDVRLAVSILRSVRMAGSQSVIWSRWSAPWAVPALPPAPAMWMLLWVPFCGPFNTHPLTHTHFTNTPARPFRTAASSFSSCPEMHDYSQNLAFRSARYAPFQKKENSTHFALYNLGSTFPDNEHCYLPKESLKMMSMHVPMIRLTPLIYQLILNKTRVIFPIKKPASHFIFWEAKAVLCIAEVTSLFSNWNPLTNHDFFFDDCLRSKLLAIHVPSMLSTHY